MAIKDKATLLAEAEVIRDETAKNANTAARVGEHLYDVIDTSTPTTDKNFVSDAQLSAIGTIGDKADNITTETTFTDTSIVVDESVEYSTVKVITGSTHARTFAASCHVSRNN